MYKEFLRELEQEKHDRHQKTMTVAAREGKPSSHPSLFYFEHIPAFVTGLIGVVSSSILKWMLSPNITA